MRVFLTVTIAALAVLGVLVFVVAPAVARPLVVDAVRAALPFGDQPLTIDVAVSGAGLLQGRIDSIHVAGSKLAVSGTNEGVTIGALDVALGRVGIGDHAFEAISGGLTSVTVPAADGQPLSISRIDLTGGSTAVTASAQLDGVEAVAFLTRELAGQGISVDSVELRDNGVSLVVFGQRVELGVDVEDGALMIPDALGAGPVTLIEPTADDRWRLTGVSITPDGMQIDAVFDAAALLAGG